MRWSWKKQSSEDTDGINREYREQTTKALDKLTTVVASFSTLSPLITPLTILNFIEVAKKQKTKQKEENKIENITVVQNILKN
jgi:hypothetical protein